MGQNQPISVVSAKSSGNITEGYKSLPCSFRCKLWSHYSDNRWIRVHTVGRRGIFKCGGQIQKRLCAKFPSVTTIGSLLIQKRNKETFLQRVKPGLVNGGCSENILMSSVRCIIRHAVSQSRCGLYDWFARDEQSVGKALHQVSNAHRANCSWVRCV